LHLHWVSAHSGITGNKRADRAARAAAEQQLPVVALHEDIEASMGLWQARDEDNNADGNSTVNHQKLERDKGVVGASELRDLSKKYFQAKVVFWTESTFKLLQYGPVGKAIYNLESHCRLTHFSVASSLARHY
jgi:hypothetical protein